MKEDSKKIVAVYACRLFSTRLFGKPLQKIGQKTILEHSIIQIKKSKKIKEIVLAISNDVGKKVFIDFAKKNNLKYVIGDEKDVLSRLIKAGRYVNADYILRVSSENPFIYWRGIDPLIKNHIQGNYDMSFLGGLPLGSGLQIVNLNSLILSHKLGKNKHRSEYCTLYISENKEKFKIYRHELEKSVNRPDIRLTVDTPEDLWVVRNINDNVKKIKKIIEIEDIIRYLDKNPKIKKFNQNVPLKFKREDL